MVRHGESERNVAKELATNTGTHSLGPGRRDIDVRLTKKSHAQTRSTGKILEAQYNFESIFTSPYRRTVQTTDEIHRHMKTKPPVQREDGYRSPL